MKLNEFSKRIQILIKAMGLMGAKTMEYKSEYVEIGSDYCETEEQLFFNDNNNDVIGMVSCFCGEFGQEIVTDILAFRKIKNKIINLQELI